MLACPDCGVLAKNEQGLKLHRTRWCQGSTAPEAPGDPDGPPAVLPELVNRIGRLKVTVVERRKKMLRPICATCQRVPGGAQMGWWLTCTHNPYVSVRQDPVTRTLYEDERDADGNPTGRKVVTGQETTVGWVAQPNWVQVSMGKRVNSGVMVQKKRRRAGFIFPEELRSPEFPNGIAECCEFRDCFRQEPLTRYKWGTFCRLIEAQLVGHDARQDGGGGALEVGDSAKSAEKQRQQLEQVPV